MLELAQRVPEHLHQRLVETNEAKRLVRHVPSLQHVAEWAVNELCNRYAEVY